MADHDDTVSRSERVADLLDDLTLEEKVSLTHGAVDPEGNATGYVPGVERLGIPELRLADGPLGVRTEEPATAFPAATALAATFDPDLAREQGRAMGREALARDQDVLLGPGLNLIRVPHNGRNFEYYSEDPLVTGRFAAGVVEGLQGEGVIATPKHYVANNQEAHRAEVSAEVDDRVLRELYLPGFRDAVEAGAGAIMTAYNRINGTYASEHEHLLREVLKGEWGFDGFAMSDWFGTQETVDVANGGLDLQMPGVTMEELMASDGTAGGDEAGPDGAADDQPGPEDEEPPEVFEEFEDGMPDPDRGDFFRDELAPAVERGDVSEEHLDDMVARQLTQLERVGLLDGDTGEGAVDTPEHRALAEEIATKGTVLLENDGVLPLADDADVALIGPNVDEAILGGGGSSETEPVVQTSPVEGVEARAEGAVTVERGHERVEGVSFLDAIMGGGDDDGPEGDVDREAAIRAAEDADVALVFVRDTATEAADRDDLRLPEAQDELVEDVAAANDRTVAVVSSSGPVELPWREYVAAVLQTWYPGQAHGDAAASVLYGDSDPGGRLPVTVAPESDYPTADERRYPGVDRETHYDEGLLVGYRHFDATGVDPTYPFGHGESYAEFRYGDVTVDGDTVRVDVANTSDRDGREVVQAYVAAPAASDDLERPPRELAGFAAVEIPAGESRTVELPLDECALGRYDADDGWTVDEGEFTVSVGRSSRDLRASSTSER